MDHLARARAEACDVYSWSNDAGDRYGAHEHTYTKLLYCTEGSIEFRLGGGRVIALVAGVEGKM